MTSRIIKTQSVHLPSFEISNDCGDYDDIDGELGVNDTPVFLLNEYTVELNPANFNILNQILK